MRAVIMCGGEGAKIWPYNRFWQKACLPVGNISNILRIVSQLKSQGISDIWVLSRYMEAQIRYILRESEGVTIVNSAPDVCKALSALCEGQDDIIVYYGDVYVHDEDFNALLENYKGQGNSVLLKSLDSQYKSLDYICADEKDGQVKAFYGHPRGNYANSKVAGVFVLDKEALSYNAFNPNIFMNVCVGNMPGKEFYFEQSLQLALEAGVSLGSVFTAYNYADMDFPWDIMAANAYFCTDVVGKLEKDDIGEGSSISEKAEVKGFVRMGKNSSIGTRVVIEGNCIIGDGVVIDNGAIIGENCVIGDNSTITNYCKLSPNTVIGAKNRIGFTAEVTGVTFDSVSAIHNCEIYGVIGRNTDIAAGCTMGILRFDDMDNPVKAPLKKYAGKYTNGIFIGDYTRTGVVNIFSPGVKIGSNSALGPGLIVSKDIAENKMVLVEQQTSEIDWGSKRYGW
ncbi:MAG: NDP-sugar synthase [Defluviitaleaceae bacterium]|nr:NDP-sugar synthase [Defluviitaleaceae bacterium]